MNITLVIAAAVMLALGGFCIGYSLNLERRPVAGKLHIEDGDPDGPYLFLELHEGLESACMNKRRILLEIERAAYPRQK